MSQKELREWKRLSRMLPVFEKIHGRKAPYVPLTVLSVDRFEYRLKATILKRWGAEGFIFPTARGLTTGGPRYSGESSGGLNPVNIDDQAMEVKKQGRNIPKRGKGDFLPIRTTAVTLIRGRVLKKVKKSQTYLLVVRNRLGLYNCYFADDPMVGDGETIYIVGNPATMNLGTIQNLFQCHLLSCKDHRSITRRLFRFSLHDAPG